MVYTDWLEVLMPFWDDAGSSCDREMLSLFFGTRQMLFMHRIFAE